MSAVSSLRENGIVTLSNAGRHPFLTRPVYIGNFLTLALLCLGKVHTK